MIVTVAQLVLSITSNSGIMASLRYILYLVISVMINLNMMYEVNGFRVWNLGQVLDYNQGVQSRMV